jgi:Leucine-rich repeat (LRR) protein
LEVKNLQLNDNELKSLTIHHAKSMILDASVNSLTSFISTGSFVHINLSNNEFSSLAQIEISEATELILSFNKIESNEMDSSEDDLEIEGIKIKTLDISYNQISSMDDLKIFKNCEFINLEGNQMQNLEFEKIRQDFPNIKRINLIKNKLNEIDLNEAKFHNDTRFLKIQFDYMEQESTTLIPPLQLFFPTLPANSLKSIETTTLLPNLTTVQYSSDEVELIEQSEFLLFIYLPILALFIASISAVIYVIYSKHSIGRFMNRKYNEAENPL